MKKRLSPFKKGFLCLLLLTGRYAMSQQILPLYGQQIPNSKPCAIAETVTGNGSLSFVTVPTLTVYLPEKQDSFKTAVIICPGGAYAHLASNHEGIDVAKAFNKRGITAFVLKYRLPNDLCFVNKTIAPIQDAQQGIILVRQKSKEFNINSVGIIGFSAGGHLASTLGTHFDTCMVDNPNETSVRPDFLILAYPVISFSDSLTHLGSRTNLTTKNPSPEIINQYSNELKITPQTPPTFLVHAADDKAVKVDNSLVFFQALQKNKVASEMHIYQRGGHGFGLNNKTTKDKWLERCFNWLTANNLIKGDIE